MALKPAQLQWSDTGILRSLDFDDVYFQPEKGREESSYVFLEKNTLAERFAALRSGECFYIAELGFGSGLNFLLTAQLWAEHAPKGARLHFTSFEKHPIMQGDLTAIYVFWPELKSISDVVLQQYPPLVEGMHHVQFLEQNIQLNLVWGDVQDWLPEVSGQVDAWYLDGFAPAKNPSMWEEVLYKEMFARTSPSGTFATFSAAGMVKRGLAAAGFSVEKTAGFGTKRDMLVGRKEGARVQKGDASKRIAVLGAGLAGASVAFALARKGYQVEVIDRQPAAAQETSGNPIGILYQKMTVEKSALGEFHAHGFSYTRNVLEALDLPSWEPCGVTLKPTTAQERERQAKILVQEYPADFIVEKEGLHQPMAGHLSPPALCQALLDHPNIQTSYSKDIVSLDDIEADAVIIALGHNSQMFEESKWLPLQSLRGQITLVEPTEQSKSLEHVVCHEGYITPVVEGVHCIGATFQKEEPETPEVREEDHIENINKLNTHLPELGITQAHVKGGRTGYRTTTPDKLPMVGRLAQYDEFVERFAEVRQGKEVEAERPYIKDIYVATGFGAHGLTGAPLAGEIVASMISGDPLPVPQWLQEYLVPERFILRDLKRKKI